MPRKRTGTDPFDKEFDLSGFERLRDFASCAFHDCNLGNRADWYGHFLGGYDGLIARLYGVRVHFREIHAWIPRKRSAGEMDYHLATILFGMDSAIECCVYALNALGCSTHPADFHDVSEDAALSRIAPKNIFGDPASSDRREHPRPGYATLFPEVQQLWKQERDLLNAMMEQHDASKHRMATINSHEELRDDPPEGFFENLNITDDLDKKEYIPYAKLYMIKGIKKPNARIEAGRGAPGFLLEDSIQWLQTFIKQTGELADQDARTYIPLCFPDVCAVKKAEEAERGRDRQDQSEG